MYNALIIGAGNIASGFDFYGNDAVLTHAHAYKKHPNFNLLGFYDTDIKKAESAAQKWGCRYFENIYDVVNNVDVVSICTPDNCHSESLRQAVKLRPKLIFLEKPITDNLSDFSELTNIIEDVPVAVNYSRRYVAEFQKLAERISDREFGDFLVGSGYYGKGFIHNGSHMIDLLRFLIGNIKSLQPISETIDFFTEDPSIDANIFFQNGAKFSMHVVNCSNFTVFETDLFFQKARIRISDSGLKIEIYKSANDELFSGYRVLKLTENFTTELKTAMLGAIDNINNFLNKQEKLRCDIHDGYEAIKYAATKKDNVFRP